MLPNITTIAGIIFLAVLIVFVLNNTRKRGMDAFSLGLLITSVALMVMIVLPEVSKQFTETIGFARQEFAFLSIVALTALFFSIKNFFKARALESSITVLARKTALEKEKK